MRGLLLLIALVVGANLKAQSVKVTRWSESQSVDAPAKDLAALFAAYSVGEMGTATTLLRRLTTAAYDAIDSTQAAKHDMLVSFVATPPLAKSPVLVSLLLPADRGVARPLPARIPGLSNLVHFYFSTIPGEDVRYSWTSEEQEDAVLGDANKFAVALAGGVAQVASALTMGQVKTMTWSPAVATPSAKDSLYVVADSILLPHKRSKIAFELVVGRPSIALHTLRSLIDSSDSDAVLNVVVASSPCAVASRRELKKEAQYYLRDRSWEGSAGPAMLHHSLVKAYSTAVALSACASPSERALAERVLQRFMSITTTEPRRVEGKNNLVNAPTRYLSVGSVVGVPVGSALGDNFAVESARVVRRPLTGLLTSAVLHLHPGVDPTSLSTTFQQRLSLFGGVVITPREGLIAGFSVQIWRGLGVQASHAWMRSNLPRDSTVVPGSAPPSEGSAFRSRVSGRYTLGFAVKL